MIKAISKDGIVRRVLLNDSVLLVDGEDKLSFYLKDESLQLEQTLNFTFSEGGEELKTSGTVQEDGKIINLTLHKWDSNLGTEVTKPIELSAKNGKRVWVKFKTSANKKASFRSFHLTVWGEE